MNAKRGTLRAVLKQQDDSHALLFSIAQDAYALLLSKVLKRRSAALSVQRLVAAAVSAAIAVKEGQLRREAEEAK